MIHSQEIWNCIKEKITKNMWVPLEDIYGLVERNLHLDDEDYEPQSANSDVPKWKRNVRNVLQHRKKSGDIEWDGQGRYKL
jgi:hypothetical protein